MIGERCGITVLPSFQNSTNAEGSVERGETLPSTEIPVLAS